MKYITEGLAEALYQRRLNESKDWSGFKVRYTYAGDSLSDYEGTCIVKAKDEKSAIKTAMNKVNKDSANHFRIDGKIESYAQYKKDFPNSNLEIFEAKSAKDYKYNIYVDRGSGKSELSAWYDDKKEADREVAFFKKKGYKVEVKVNEAVNESTINEATTQDYINQLEFVLKKFTSIDDKKLKKAVDMAIEDSKKGNSSNFVSNNLNRSTLERLYDGYANAVRDINLMINILKGNKQFKRVWTPESPLYDSGTAYLRRTNASKEWKDCLGLIRETIEACRSYHSIYWDHGTYSDIIKEVQSVIKSGGLYQETIKDLKEICMGATGSCIRIYDGPGRLMMVDVGYGKANVMQAQIKKYMAANKDKYPELEFNDAFRSRTTDCIVARFKVALEKVPKTDVQVSDTKLEVPEKPQISDVSSQQPSGKYTNFKVPSRDIQKMSEYFNKGSNPKTLANTVKDVDKAVSRYYISVATGWKECEETFYQRCLDLGVSEADLKEIHDKASKDTSIDIKSNTTVTTRKSVPAKSKEEEIVYDIPTGVPFEGVDMKDINEGLKVVDSGTVKVKKAFTVKEFDEDDGWVETKIKPGTYKYQVVDFRGWKPRQLYVNGEWIDVAGDCVELEELLGDSKIDGSKKVVEAVVDEARWVTMAHRHVLVSDDGEIMAGGPGAKKKFSSGDIKAAVVSANKKSKEHDI